MSRSVFTLLFVVIGTLVAESAAAQRREAPAPPPLSFSVTPWNEDGVSPYRRVVSLEASAQLEIVADRRLLRFEVRPAGSRRVLHCEHPDRPSRVEDARLRVLASGERWAEWIDLREYCWGASLTALRGEGAAVVAYYGPRRARRNQFVARQGATTFASVGPVPLAVGSLPVTNAEPTEGALRVVVSDRDVTRGASLTLPVRVRASGSATRAYVRSDRVRFEVVGPSGARTCAMPYSGGTAPPELFRRFTRTSGASFSLDMSFYCRGAFREAGIYELTPFVEVDQGGERWGIEAAVGVFTGAPAILRVRRGADGYVERSLPPAR